MPAVISVYLEPEAFNGAKHFFAYFKAAKNCLPIREFEHIKPYFVGNGYFAHPENVLYAG